MTNPTVAFKTPLRFLISREYYASRMLMIFQQLRDSKLHPS